MSEALRICLVEDDPILGESLSDRLEIEGFEVDWHPRASDALAALAAGAHHLLVSDIRLPDMAGDALFEALIATERSIPPVVFITAYGDIEHAVRLLRMGAADYVTKPFDIEELVAKARTLCTASSLARRRGEAPVLGISGAMREVERTLPRIARYGSTVLLSGESGVGKEMTARLLHREASGEEERPFVAVNCSAIAETLVETELFGHERGAFTGATRERRGVFEQADGGTLFLDEIGDMPLATQAKVLRAVQDREIVRVGGEQPVRVEVRLVCATNQDLTALIRAGAFREDLYYRINVINVRIPPLRERPEDILWLADACLREHARQYPGDGKTLHPAARNALLAHDWPGNVRELRHCLERACVLTTGRLIAVGDLFETAASSEHPCGPAPVGRLKPYLQECERDYLERALERNGGAVGQTAEQLGISRKSLWERMKRLGMEAG